MRAPFPFEEDLRGEPAGVFFALAGGAATSAGAAGAAGGGAEGSGSIGAAETGALTSVPAAARTNGIDQWNRFIPAEYQRPAPMANEDGKMLSRGGDR